MDGTLTWDQCASLAESNGGHLPSSEELIEYAAKVLKNQSIANEDMWIPISDLPNDWMSLGNYDMRDRYKCRHTLKFGQAGWSTVSEFAPYRRLLVVKRTQILALEPRILVTQNTHTALVDENCRLNV